MSERPSFFAELKRRNVYKVGVAYAVVGWLIAQIATQIFPFLEIPNWAIRLVVLLIVIGIIKVLQYTAPTEGHVPVGYIAQAPIVTPPPTPPAGSLTGESEESNRENGHV